MAKDHPLGYEEFSEAFDYDQVSGRITWKVKPNRRTHIGAEAGMVKNARASGKEPKHYRYIIYRGFTTTAARVAWLLSYKEWPKRNILYNDRNTLNVAIANLRLGDHWSGDSNGALPDRKMNKVAARHYQLQRYYGLTGEQYGQMLASQGGVCAICKSPEVRLDRNGVPVALHVDHDHETGKVRSLLCYKCNSALGSMDDSPARLRAAAEYIEAHRMREGA